MPIFIIDTATFAISILMLVKNIKKVSYNSRFLLYALFFLFYVLPLGLDLIFGYMDLAGTAYKYFYISRHNLPTCIIYDIFLIYCQYYILIKNNNYQFTQSLSDTFNKNRYKIILFAFAFAPTFFVITLLRQPGMLYTFQWREFEIFSATGSYSAIEKLSYLAISCSVLLMFDKNSKWYSLLRLIAIPLLLANVCIQGKRAILFFAMFNIAIILYFRFVDKIRAKKSVFMLGVVSISLVVAAIISMISGHSQMSVAWPNQTMS